MGNNLKTTIPEADARLVQQRGDVWIAHQDSNEEAITLMREWPNIDASVADTLVITLLGTSVVTDPLADGQTYTGRFAVSDVVVVENPRRWVTIRQTLTWVTNVTTSAELTVPVILGREEVYRAFEWEAGAGTARVYQYKYLDPAAREVCLLTITDGQMFALTGLTQRTSSTSTGFEIEERRWEIGPRGDRTGTLTVLYREPRWTNANESQDDVDVIHATGEAGKVNEDEFLGYKDVKTERAFGVAQEEAESVYAGWLADIESNLNEPYKVTQISMLKMPNGEVHFLRTSKKRNVLSGAITVLETNAIIMSKSKNLAGLTTRIVVLFPNLNKETSDILIENMRTETEFTFGGHTYKNGGFDRTIDEAGLSTFRIVGIQGMVSAGANYPEGDIDVYKEELHVSDDGTIYLKLIGRRVTTSLQEAIDWAKLSSDLPPIHDLRTHKDGFFVFRPELGVYVSWKERWKTANDFMDLSTFEQP